MNRLPFQFLFFCIPILLLICTRTPAQDSSQKLTESEQELILKKTGELLKNNYVFLELGQACANFLDEQNRFKHYSQITHPRAFAKQLSTDLKNIHHDQHIRVQTRTPADRRLVKDPNLNFFLHTHERIKENLGFRQVRILTGNVGYLDIRSFEPLELAREKALSVLQFLKDTDAMIIDLRANIGGNPSTVQFLCSLFFDKPVHLNSIYWRREDYTEEFWTMDHIGIAKKPDIPIFILVSSKTFSAGEEMAYNLQVQNRAVLVGETTAGGANPGYSFTINERFSIFIPTGRSINPVTGTNWEGSGVKPDIQVKASESLTVAAEKAVHAARIYREKSDDRLILSLMSVSAQLDTLTLLYKNNKKSTIDSLAIKLLSDWAESDLINEWVINDLGYKYMSKNEIDVAFVLFQFNVIQYPHSFNVYDSLGEIYWKTGEKSAAIKNYTRSLILNPQNFNAQRMIKLIEKDNQHN